jgi:hypothetical protein
MLYWDLGEKGKPSLARSYFHKNLGRKVLPMRAIVASLSIHRGTVASGFRPVCIQPHTYDFYVHRNMDSVVAIDGTNQVDLKFHVALRVCAIMSMIFCLPSLLVLALSPQSTYLSFLTTFSKKKYCAQVNQPKKLHFVFELYMYKHSTSH